MLWSGKLLRQEAIVGALETLIQSFDRVALEGIVLKPNMVVPGKKSTDPDPEGSLLLYFNCSGRLDDAISMVEPNGGKVVQPKHQIGPHGFRAIVLDSEGNRVALHSR